MAAHNLSLGRISQMIQLAVTDELIRYHKTLLLWTNKVTNPEELL